ncbi:hypothetical protein HAX54_023529, partial [Datura stramonium]|nr:hypothetical protein [Datura stramonium]
MAWVSPGVARHPSRRLEGVTQFHCALPLLLPCPRGRKCPHVAWRLSCSLASVAHWAVWQAVLHAILCNCHPNSIQSSSLLVHCHIQPFLSMIHLQTCANHF